VYDLTTLVSQVRAHAVVAHLEIQLVDLDLAGRSLTIDGNTRPLDDLTYLVLQEWLDHRRRPSPSGQGLRDQRAHHGSVRRQCSVNAQALRQPGPGLGHGRHRTPPAG
jgi:hypothetical protein